MLDTHYHIKKLQEASFSENQAEAIVELVVTNNKNFNERFDRLESYLEKKFDYIDKKFEYIEKRFEHVDNKFDSMDAKIESMKSQILTWMGLGLAFIGVMIIISTVYR